MPSAPELSLAVSSCTVQLSWLVRKDGGRPVDNYDVEIRDGSGAWKIICEETKMTKKCEIKMPTLIETFSLQLGKEAKFRIRAYNTLGHGPWGKATLPSVYKKPGTMEKPTGETKNGEIELKWATPKSGEQNGGT